jgi:tetratricopeptide (TPR) repeat protein
VSDAVAIFKLNAIEHPFSSNAFDSLGEAYRANSERSLAIISYKKAILLDPTNGHAAGELKKLSLGRALWLVLLAFGAIGLLLVAAILVKRRRRRPPNGELPKA